MHLLINKLKACDYVQGSKFIELTLFCSFGLFFRSFVRLFVCLFVCIEVSCFLLMCIYMYTTDAAIWHKKTHEYTFIKLFIFM